MCWSCADPLSARRLRRVAAAAASAGTPLSAVLAGGRLVQPCACSGSVAFLHVRCLAAWQASLLRRGLARRAARCELCGGRYRERAPAALVLHYAKGGETLTLPPPGSPRDGSSSGEEEEEEQGTGAGQGAAAAAGLGRSQRRRRRFWGRWRRPDSSSGNSNVDGNESVQQTRPRRRGVAGAVARLAGGAAREAAADARVCRAAAAAIPSLLLRGWRAYAIAAGAVRAARGAALGLAVGAAAGRSLASEQGRVLASFAASISGVAGAGGGLAPLLARVLWLHAMGALALGMATEVAYASLAGAGAGAALGFARGSAGAVRQAAGVGAGLAGRGLARAAVGAALARQRARLLLRGHP